MQFLLGTTVIPREIEDNGYAKSLDVNKLRYGLCENAELGTLIKNDDNCNENMNNKRIRDYLKLLLAALAIIVHVLNKTSLCRKFHVVVAPRKTWKCDARAALFVSSSSPSCDKS